MKQFKGVLAKTVLPWSTLLLVWCIILGEIARGASNGQFGTGLILACVWAVSAAITNLVGFSLEFTAEERLGVTLWGPIGVLAWLIGLALDCRPTHMAVL